jgi:thiol-disulfide isomerase/thioredoxin
MERQTNQMQKSVTYALIVIGILGIGLLGYVVGSRLMSPPPATAPVATPATAVTDPIVSRPGQSSQPQGTTDVQTGIRIGQRAPDFVLRSLDNIAIALSDFVGKVVILDFWASWCGPCKTSMPKLESLARALAGDVILVGVSLDRSAANASNYLADNDYQAMVALYENYAAAYNVFETYGGGGIPKTFVIDREGIIRYVGHPASPSLSRQTIERLI